MRSEKQEPCRWRRLWTLWHIYNLPGTLFLSNPGATESFTLRGPVTWFQTDCCQIITALMWKHSEQGPISSQPSWHSMNEKFTLPNTQTHSTWWIIPPLLSDKKTFFTEIIIIITEFKCKNIQFDSGGPSTKPQQVDRVVLITSLMGLIWLRKHVRQWNMFYCICFMLVDLWRLINKIDIGALWWSTCVITLF